MIDVRAGQAIVASPGEWIRYGPEAEGAEHRGVYACLFAGHCSPRSGVTLTGTRDWRLAARDSGFVDRGLARAAARVCCRMSYRTCPRGSVAAAAVIILLATAADAQWLNYPTPGTPRLPDGTPNLAAPAPRGADGRRICPASGQPRCAIYGRDSCFTRSLFFNLAKDLQPDEQMTPWAAQIQAQRESRNHVDDPYGYCLPPGTPRINFEAGRFAFSTRRKSPRSCTKRSSV